MTYSTAFSQSRTALVPNFAKICSREKKSNKAGKIRSEWTPPIRGGGEAP